MKKKFIKSTIITLTTIMSMSTLAFAGVDEKQLPAITTEDSKPNIVVKQTQEELKLSRQKMDEAEKYVKTKETKSNGGRQKRSYGGYKAYYVSEAGVGNRRQEKPTWCGPATIYNIAEIYDYEKYGTYKSATQATYASNQWLSTFYNNGTNFSSAVAITLNGWVPGNNYTLFNAKANTSSISAWTDKLKNGVIWTIDKNNGWGKTGYSVAANMNYSSNSDAAQYPIHSYYGGRGVAHWIAVYGYDGDMAYVSDSNTNMVRDGYSTLIKCTFSDLARATYDRGIVY